MNSVTAISKQIFLSHPNYLGKNLGKRDVCEFQAVYSRQNRGDILNRYHSCSKGIAVPPAVLSKLKAEPEQAFEEVTYDKEFEHLQECGPYKVYRTYLDNGKGNGEKAFYVIRLKTSSKDIKIDSSKLQDIFNKALTIVKKMVPIYAKMNGTAILAGIDYTLPFNEARQTVDFETFAKQLIEGTDSLISNSDLDDDTKAALQKMLKECEDFLLKVLENDEEKTSGTEASFEKSARIVWKDA